jgi:hypothetical protein
MHEPDSEHEPKHEPKPERPSAVVLVRRIPRTVSREQLEVAASAFGPLRELVRLHGQRQAIVEFAVAGAVLLASVLQPSLRRARCTEAAAVFVAHYISHSLVLNGKVLAVSRGSAPVVRRALDSFADVEVLREVTHAVDAIVRTLAAVRP